MRKTLVRRSEPVDFFAPLQTSHVLDFHHGLLEIVCRDSFLKIVKGVFALADKGCGALIVLERDIMVDYHIEFGTEVDAKLSAELLLSIFNVASPMHDGAVLIRGGKIHSAGNFLPLSKNPVLDKNLGTRHRAAIGLTEESDSIVIIVSEENRSVGLVHSGQLDLMHNTGNLRQSLYDVFGLKLRSAVASENYT